MLADRNAADVCRDRFELTAKINRSMRLEIERLQLRRTSEQIDKDARLGLGYGQRVLSLQLPPAQEVWQTNSSQRQRPGPQQLPPRGCMTARFKAIDVKHVSLAQQCRWKNPSGVSS